MAAMEGSFHFLQPDSKLSFYFLGVSDLREDPLGTTFFGALLDNPFQPKRSIIPLQKIQSIKPPRKPTHSRRARVKKHPQIETAAARSGGRRRRALPQTKNQLSLPRFFRMMNMASRPQPFHSRQWQFSSGCVGKVCFTVFLPHSLAIRQYTDHGT